MRKKLLILTAVLFSCLKSYAQKEEKGKEVDFLRIEFEKDYNFVGSLENDETYWVGVDFRKDYNKGDFQKVLSQAAKHIKGLHDTLQNPYTQKNLRIVLFPDGNTATFNLKEKEMGKDMVFHDGEYVALKTTYDTLQIVQRKEKQNGEWGNTPYCVLYTISLKDINDLPKLVENNRLILEKEVKIEKQVSNSFLFRKKVFTSLSFGASVGTFLPVAGYLEAGYYYILDGRDYSSMQGYKESRGFIGLIASTSASVRNDSVMALSNIGLSIGGAKVINGRIAQKVDAIVGMQFLSKQGKTYGPPIFMLGLNFPAFNNISAGMIVGTNFKDDYEYKYRRTNFAVVLKFNF